MVYLAGRPTCHKNRGKCPLGRLGERQLLLVADGVRLGQQMASPVHSMCLRPDSEVDLVSNANVFVLGLQNT